MKGTFMGPCKRERCDRLNSRFFNSSTRAFYCGRCARKINETNPGLCVDKTKEIEDGICDTCGNQGYVDVPEGSQQQHGEHVPCPDCKPLTIAQAAEAEITTMLNMLMHGHSLDEGVIANVIDRHIKPMFMPPDGPLPTMKEMAELGWDTDVFGHALNRASAAINAAWFKKVKGDGHAMGLIPSPLYWLNKFVLPLLHKTEPMLTEAQKMNDRLVAENRMLKFEAEQRETPADDFRMIDLPNLPLSCTCSRINMVPGESGGGIEIHDKGCPHA